MASIQVSKEAIPHQRRLGKITRRKGALSEKLLAAEAEFKQRFGGNGQLPPSWLGLIRYVSAKEKIMGMSARISDLESEAMRVQRTVEFLGDGPSQQFARMEPLK